LRMEREPRRAAAAAVGGRRVGREFGCTSTARQASRSVTAGSTTALALKRDRCVAPAAGGRRRRGAVPRWRRGQPRTSGLQARLQVHDDRPERVGRYGTSRRLSCRCRPQLARGETRSARGALPPRMSTLYPLFPPTARCHSKRSLRESFVGPGAV